MSIISNLAELTGVASNGLALETVLSNNQNVYGAPFHVRLNNATGCNFTGGYGWFYNNTEFTFNYLYAFWTKEGAWAGPGNCMGNILDDVNNAMTCPVTTINLYTLYGDSDYSKGYWVNVTVRPGQKIWVGDMIRPDNNWYGGYFKEGYLYVTKPN